MAKKTNRLTIGRTDRIDFPDLDLFDISCKVDTGANTSSVHCHHVQLVERQGETLLRFKLLDPAHLLYSERNFEVFNFSQKLIKNSSGVVEHRYVIHSQILIFSTLLNIDLTLADREEMKYPVLLGRKFLAHNHFLVDVTRMRISHKEKCKLLMQLSKEKQNANSRPLSG